MKTRVFSAVVILPLVVAVLILGSWPFALFLSSFILIGGFEYQRMLQRKGYCISLPILWLLILLWMAAAYWPAGGFLEPGLVLLILAGVGWQLAFHSATVDPTASWALTLAGGRGFLSLAATCAVRGLLVVTDGSDHCVGGRYRSLSGRTALGAT